MIALFFLWRSQRLYCNIQLGSTSWIRISKKWLPENTRQFFSLHGNVLSGYCEKDNVFGWTDDKCVCAVSFSGLLVPYQWQEDIAKDNSKDAHWERIEMLEVRGLQYLAIAHWADRCNSQNNFLLQKKMHVKQFIEIEIIDP